MATFSSARMGYPMNMMTSVQSTSDLGVYPAGVSNIIGRQRLPTEAIGSVDLTFAGLKLGSELKIIGPGNVLLADVESSVALTTVNVPYYAPGNTNNVVRIFINSLAYEVLDFSYTLTAVDTTIPVFQRKDRNYSNPT